jgi:hypothetical protein
VIATQFLRRDLNGGTALHNPVFISACWGWLKGGFMAVISGRSMAGVVADSEIE